MLPALSSALAAQGAQAVHLPFGLRLAAGQSSKAIYVLLAPA